jgi:hypothetical protein
MPDFSDTRNLLNRKPRIEFVEPDQIQDPAPPVDEVEPTLNAKKEQVIELIKQYKRIEDLAVLAQERIDNRVKDLRINLNPSIDALVVESLKRTFGTEDTHITYAQYKECLAKVAQAGKDAAPKLTAADMKAMASDPFRKDFGGYGGESGSLRPELNIDSPVKPVELSQFQNEALGKLFDMLLPKLTALNKFMIDEAIEEALKGK